MIKTKIISGLDKPFAASDIDSYERLTRMSALRGERISLQLLSTMIYTQTSRFSRKFEVKLDGELAKYATLRIVRHVPSLNNTRGDFDDDFILKSPGLVPDVLSPLEYGGMIVLAPGNLLSTWIEIEIPEDEAAGVKKFSINIKSLTDDPNMESYDVTEELEIEVIGATLPHQKLLFTQWFHSDCLAEYYRVEKWSDEHFRIIKNFARTAKKNGINMLFTPLISPPLDNAYDTRDLQLSIVTKTDDGYEFNWKHLERWILTLDDVGIKYFEVGHLFTQGGATNATKVMGYVDGSLTRLFPADTPCDDPEYTKFLRAMLTSFLAFMKARGDDTRCYFHISDEPPLKYLETYTKAKDSIADIIAGYPIMDALSHYEFYKTGAVKKPVVLLNHLEEFANEGVRGLWTYNCCAPDGGYSNRFLGMSLSRNRSICLALYKFDVEGFLHWGYNFYNNSGSSDFINPYLDNASGDIFPSGDPFSVYPAHSGEALESLRLVTFHEAIQDLRAFRLCEELYSREEVIGALEEAYGKEIGANAYVNESAPFILIREKINAMIKERIGNA